MLESSTAERLDAAAVLMPLDVQAAHAHGSVVARARV